MRKFLTLLLFLAPLFANDDTTYVIEAKGEFGKELKELVEKHSKDQNVNINVYENSNGSSFAPNSKARTLEAAKSNGEKLYADNCFECHGDMGKKRSYATAKRLSQMDADDIYMSFRAYVSNPSHGSSAGSLIMTPIASRITDTELGYIIAYLKNDTTYVWGKTSKRENTNISRNPTSQGTYLK